MKLPRVVLPGHGTKPWYQTIVLVWRPGHASYLSCHVVNHSGADTVPRRLRTPNPATPPILLYCPRRWAGAGEWMQEEAEFLGNVFPWDLGAPPLGLPYSEEGQRVSRESEGIWVVFVYLVPTW